MFMIPKKNLLPKCTLDVSTSECRMFEETTQNCPDINKMAKDDAKNN